MPEGRPAQGRHEEVVHQVKDKHLGAQNVDGIHHPRDVPEENLFAEEGDIAAEEAGKHENRGEDTHAGAGSQLLQRIEFFFG